MHSSKDWRNGRVVQKHSLRRIAQGGRALRALWAFPTQWSIFRVLFDIAANLSKIFLERLVHLLCLWCFPVYHFKNPVTRSSGPEPFFEANMFKTFMFPTKILKSVWALRVEFWDVVSLSNLLNSLKSSNRDRKTNTIVLHKLVEKQQGRSQKNKKNMFRNFVLGSPCVSK